MRLSRTPRAWCAALVIATALVAGCERVPSEDAGAHGLQVGDPALPRFTRGDPRLEVAHSGERRIEFRVGGRAAHAFRERIQTDGRGRFSIRPLELLDPGEFDWGGFELTQLAREGFLFRYRDFAVRDPRLFARNWVVVEQPGTQLVAGRTCRPYRVERRAGGNAYELLVDVQTGLVLASDQRDAGGQLLARMRYESVDYAPDLSGAIWHVDVLPEEVLDPALPLADQVEHRALEPRLLPAGYERVEAAVLTHGGKDWLRLTYSDGVEALFFLQALVAPSPKNVARAAGPARPSAVPDSTSSVVVFQVGAALAIQGWVDGFELMAIGLAPEAELLDMLESALP